MIDRLIISEIKDYFRNTELNNFTPELILEKIDIIEAKRIAKHYIEMKGKLLCQRQDILDSKDQKESGRSTEI